MESVAPQRRQREDRDLRQTGKYLDNARTRYRNASSDSQRRIAQRDIDILQRRMDRLSQQSNRCLTRSIASISIQ